MRLRRDLVRTAEPPRQPRHQPIELLDIVAVEARARGAHRGAADGAAPAEYLFADREADADLLLVPHQRQIGVEQILRLLAAAVAEEAADVDQQLRIGETGHRAVGAAMQLLRQVEPAIAAKNTEAPPRRAVAGAPHLAELAQARPVLVLEHHEARMRVDQTEEG